MISLALFLSLREVFLSNFERCSRAPGHVGSENGRNFDFAFQRFQCRGNDLAAQLPIQLGRQARIAARVGNRNPLDDAACADLLRDRIHRAHNRHREFCSVQFFADHSAAATAGSSGRHQQDAVDSFFA